MERERETGWSAMSDAILKACVIVNFLHFLNVARSINNFLAFLNGWTLGVETREEIR